MLCHFLLGQLKIESRVSKKLGRCPLDLIARHAINEHGKITPDEMAENLRAVKECGTIKSRYMVDPTDPTAGFVLVTTDEGWAHTTVTLEKQ